MEALSLVCGGLGIAEEDEAGNRIGYSREDNCLENLKDLLRFLRRGDPETREVFKQACKWKVVSKDLIPIIQYCQAERSLVLNAVKVLVFLTMPMKPSSHDNPQQIRRIQRWPETLSVLLIVLSPSWKRKKREEGLLECGIRGVIHNLVEHLHDFPWMVLKQYTKEILALLLRVSCSNINKFRGVIKNCVGPWDATFNKRRYFGVAA